MGSYDADIIIGFSSETIDAIKAQGVVLPYPVAGRIAIKRKLYDEKSYWRGRTSALSCAIGFAYRTFRSISSLTTIARESMASCRGRCGWDSRRRTRM